MAMEEDLIIRRMCLVTHVIHLLPASPVSPFLCFVPMTFQMAPHVPGKDMDSVNSSLLLALVHHGAIKRLTAAQDIIKTLSISYKKENDDHAKCEQLDYLYAAGLILIAAMRITYLMNGTQHCGSPTAAIDRSMTTVENDVRQVDHLLRYYQERCEQVPRLKRHMERCRDALAMIRLQYVSSSVITDNEITFCRNVWLRIYDRLSLDIPFQRFSHGWADNGKTTGRRMTFGWLKSLSFDLDSQGE